jgi:uncharacterized protein (TIGR00369 family)
LASVARSGTIAGSIAETAVKLNPDYLQALRSRVESAPFPSLVGFRLAVLEIDACRIDLDVDQRHLQPFGIAHGGVVATLVDTATFWAAFLRLPADAGLVNADLKLNYLRPVATGQRLRAHGTCLRPGRQVSVCEARIEDDAGTLVAQGTSTLLALPGRGLDVGMAKFLD